MTAFEHVLVLLSFVYALALTHLLSRIVTLYNLRERVRFSGLQATATVNCVMVVFVSWLALWPTRTIRDWDLFSIVAQFVYAIFTYFLCALAAPEISPDGTIDLDAFYMRQRKSFFVVYILICVAGIVANFSYLKSSSPYNFLLWNIASVVLAIPPLFALAFKARWVQWVAGIVLIGILTVTAVTIVPALT
jgi:hypothetical protein